jgi:hypothetical protein
MLGLGTNINKLSAAEAASIAARNAGSYLLDDYSGAAAAYSLRQLSSTYSGSSVKVRRASDNVEADIGFASGELDTAALASHCGSNNGFVSKIYDQSGNGRDATQTTAAYQRKIYDATTGVVTYNGKPAMFHTGVSGGMYVHNIPAGTTWSSFATFKTNTTNGVGVHSRVPYSPWWYLAEAGSNNTTVVQFANTELYKNGNALTISTRGALASDIGTNQQTISAFGDLTENGSNNWHLWSAYGTSYYNLQGYVYEAIIYPSDQSSNRSDIEDNINTFYSIY